MECKKIIKSVLFALICLIVIMFIFGLKLYSKYSISPSKYIDKNTQSIRSMRTISLDDSIKTPTGIAYDDVAGTFWLCDFGSPDTSRSIYELSDNFSFIKKQIILDSILEVDCNLQGITYDSQDDSFWIAVGSSIVEINKEGKKINEIMLDEFKKYQSNGIAYDKENDTLWILCYRKLLINCSKDGKIQRVINCNIRDQDQLLFYDSSSLYFSAGSDYRGKNNFIIKIEISTNRIKALYRLEDSFAIEGIFMLDGMLYVVNDGIFHNAKIDENYIACYKLN